jgi:hypothetical protein
LRGNYLFKGGEEMEFISDITLEVNSNTAYTVIGAK